MNRFKITVPLYLLIFVFFSGLQFWHQNARKTHFLPCSQQEGLTLPVLGQFFAIPFQHFYLCLPLMSYTVNYSCICHSEVFICCNLFSVLGEMQAAMTSPGAHAEGPQAHIVRWSPVCMWQLGRPGLLQHRLGGRPRRSGIQTIGLGLGYNRLLGVNLVITLTLLSGKCN